MLVIRGAYIRRGLYSGGLTFGILRYVSNRTKSENLHRFFPKRLPYQKDHIAILSDIIRFRRLQTFDVRK